MSFLCCWLLTKKSVQILQMGKMKCFSHKWHWKFANVLILGIENLVQSQCLQEIHKSGCSYRYLVLADFFHRQLFLSFLPAYSKFIVWMTENSLGRKLTQWANIKINTPLVKRGYMVFCASDTFGESSIAEWYWHKTITIVEYQAFVVCLKWSLCFIIRSGKRNSPIGLLVHLAFYW